MSAEGATEKEGGNSYFPIEWTNQHGCGENTPEKPNKLNCNMVLQFMCQKDDGDDPDKYTMRDGTSTSRNNYQAPSSRNRGRESESSFKNRQRASSSSRGMHEPFAWYDKCNKRNRNKGLLVVLFLI